MDALETALRANMEAWQYAAFFGGLVLLGTLEVYAGLGRQDPERTVRWPANGLLTFINIMLLGAIPLSGLAVADFAAERGWGLLNALPMPLVAALAIGILARSLMSWLIHWAMHRVPVLWRIHRVHHSDTGLDVSTTVRFHPLEFLVSTPLVIALVLALGIPPVAIIVYEIFDAAMAVFSHANIRLPRPIERPLSWLIVTPHMHRIHHSSWQPETDSNYGATLSVWDRLFGTFRSKTDAELSVMETGLTEYRDRRTSSMQWLLMLPFRSVISGTENRDREPVATAPATGTTTQEGQQAWAEKETT